MLTKEEYIDIIENLDFFYGDNLMPTAELRKEKSKEIQEKDLENFKKKINCLKQLINEHFDNPPLKFEELKENMWVWDSKYNEWCYICFISGKYPHRKYIDNCISDGIFEENRFYRREVKV